MEGKLKELVDRNNELYAKATQIEWRALYTRIDGADGYQILHGDMHGKTEGENLANLRLTAALHNDWPAISTALLAAEEEKKRLERDDASILMLGGTYVTQGGEHVTMVKIHNVGTPYETLEDEHGAHRYSRRLGDMGRATGTAHDYSAPQNIRRPIRAVALREVESAESRLSAAEARVGRWIPVTERLPDSRLVLAFYRNTLGKARTVRAFYAPRFTVEDSSDNDLGDGNEERDDTTYLLEGWYEENDNADYFYPIRQPVTHWQSLPEPPDSARQDTQRERE